MQKSIFIIILMVFITFLDAGWRTKERAKTSWVGKTTQNFAIIMEENTLYVIKPTGRSRLKVTGEGPSGGFGRWYYFDDEINESHFCKEGVLVNLTDTPVRKRCSRRRGYYLPTGEIPPFDMPNEAYEGGARGNALLPTMDDDFPFNAF